MVEHCREATRRILATSPRGRQTCCASWQAASTTTRVAGTPTGTRIRTRGPRSRSPRTHAETSWSSICIRREAVPRRVALRPLLTEPDPPVARPRNVLCHPPRWCPCANRLLRVNGKRLGLGLGAYPDVSLKEARPVATNNRALAKGGFDPRHRGGYALTFAQANDEYIRWKRFPRPWPATAYRTSAASGTTVCRCHSTGWPRSPTSLQNENRRSCHADGAKLR